MLQYLEIKLGDHDICFWTFKIILNVLGFATPVSWSTVSAGAITREIMHILYTNVAPNQGCRTR